MMSVVRFVDEVGQRELELVRPQAPCFVLRREVVVLAEKQQDIRGLTDQALAGLQERWRERRIRESFLVQQLKHAVLAALGASDVDVAHAGFFERESHKFAASLNRSPVVELVAH